VCSARRSQIAERGLGVDGLECKTPKGERQEGVPRDGGRVFYIRDVGCGFGGRTVPWALVVRAVWLVWFGLVFSVRRGPL
jgi:hypothetical protein